MSKSNIRGFGNFEKKRVSPKQYFAHQQKTTTSKFVTSLMWNLLLELFQSGFNLKMQCSMTFIKKKER